MTDETLDSAILRTVLYADVFDFALTVNELHRFLMHHSPVALAEIQRALDGSPALEAALARSGEWVALKSRQSLFGMRDEREAVAARLWPLARRYAAALALLPFVRMVALTGALAMRNPVSTDDDLDYLIVTRPGRVWLARLASVMLVRIVRLTGTEICPNFVLAEDALVQNRRDVYIAHEVVQAVPFFGGALYERLRAENRWADSHLPNASGAPHPAEIRAPSRAGAAVKHLLEWVLGGKLGDRIEAWEKARKMRRFEALRQAESAARIDDSQVKGHFNDHGESVLEQYRRRLSAYGLTERVDTELAAD